MSSSPSSRSVTTAGNDARCPNCRSRLRAEQTWCSLCHTDLRAVSEDTSSSTPAVVDELGDSPADPRRPLAEGSSAEGASADGSSAATADEELTPERSAARAEAAAAAERLLVELKTAE